MSTDFKKTPHDGVVDSTDSTMHRSQSNEGAASNEVYLAKLTKWWSDDEEAVVRRKLDVRIVTTSFLLYLAALLDRSNVGNAKTAGMVKALHMTDAQFRGSSPSSTSPTSSSNSRSFSTRSYRLECGSPSACWYGASRASAKQPRTTGPK